MNPQVQRIIPQNQQPLDSTEPGSSTNFNQTSPTPITPPSPGTTQVVSAQQQVIQQDVGGNLNYNIVGRRIVAALIDIVIWVLILIVAAQHFGQVRSSNYHYSANLNGLPGIIFVVLALAYYVLLEWLAGGTLGKLALGIGVKDEQGARLTFSKSLVRNLLRIIDDFPYIIPYLAGIITLSTNDKKQRLGDKAAHTVVIRTGERVNIWLKFLPVLIIVLAIFAAFAFAPSTPKNTDIQATNNAPAPTSFQATEAEQISNEFVGYIVSDNAQAAYQLASPALRAISSESQQAASIHQLHQYIKGKPELLNGQPPAKNDIAVYVYNAQTPKGTKPLVMSLQYANGKWLVSGAQLETQAP